MELQAFQGSTYLWHQPTMLGRSTYPQLESFGAQREEGLGYEGERVNHTATRVDEDGFGGEANKTRMGMVRS